MSSLTALEQYQRVTANYWAFTLTDGALRMLVVFHFHQLGYTSLEIAFLFLFYEFFGRRNYLYTSCGQYLIQIIQEINFVRTICLNRVCSKEFYQI